MCVGGMIINSNASMDSSRAIDLHGLHVTEALHILPYAIRWWERNRCGNVRIITGAGSHSVGGRSRLKPAVERALSKGTYRYDSSSAVGEIICILHIHLLLG